MEKSYNNLGQEKNGLDHAYGSDVHILAEPFTLGLLAELGKPETRQPRFNEILETLYRGLLQRMIGHEFPRRLIECETNMIQSTPKGVFHGQIVDPESRAVTVNVARAGTIPSHLCQNVLHQVIDPANVRQDHVIMERTTDETGAVTGAALHGSKIGGDVEGAHLIFPDPMGATGSSLSKVISHYRSEVGGTPASIMTAHLIVTPEFIRNMKNEQPGVKIWALRLDRGESPEDVLSMRPGEDSRESGLNEIDYIVPGAGGVGEIINNSWI